jgi:hypothetical protein
MSGAIEIVAYAVLAPAAASFAIYWFAQPFLHSGAAERYSAAVAFAVGYCTGFILLGWPNDLLPARHWHWTLYLAPAAALLGPIAASKGLALPERWLLLLIGSLAAAWVLVPHWTDLQPPRSVWVPLLAAYVFLLAALLEHPLEKLPAPRMLFVLGVSAMFIAFVAAAFINVMTYAQFAASAGAALVGCSAAARFSNAESLRGIGLAYAVIVGGWAFILCTHPQPPNPGILLAPAAPLVMWLFVRGPLAKLRGWTAIGVQIALVVVILALSGALVVMKAGPE